MTKRPFSQVDVFSVEPGLGNPVAVVHEADGLDDETMAAFARWTNLSETTFLLEPTDPAADYRLRIFTPGGELPFAGHPTLGSAYAWLTAGGTPATSGRVVQECGIGLVELRRDPSGLLAFAAPPLIRSGAPDDATRSAALASLGITDDDVVDVSWVVNGPEFLGVLLRDADAVLALEPDFSAMADAGLAIGAVAPHAPGSTVGADLEVRGFVPGIGVDEDPVTGSLNAGLARWLVGAGHLSAPYVAAQGTALGRRGRVHISPDAERPDEFWVAGETTTVIEGTVELG